MPLSHKLILYVTLAFLCLSLMGPGLWELFRNSPGSPGLVAQHVDALNQLRAYNGMVTAVGFMSGFAMIKIEQNRTLVFTLAIIMLFLATSRIISILIDGVPGFVALSYLGVEILIAVILFIFLPAKRARC